MCKASVRAPALIAGATPRGFRDMLVGAMDAEVITGATEAIDEPTDRGEKSHVIAWWFLESHFDINEGQHFYSLIPMG